MRILVILLLTLMFGSLAAAEQLSSHKYFIKPSDVQMPAGADWGQIKRTIQPFENWTLICDENLKLKQRTCNVSQVILDRQDNRIFSWSLAATKDGEPFMLMRVNSAINRQTPLSVWFEGRSTPVKIEYKGCDKVVCLAVMPVGPLTRTNIDKGADVKITFLNEAGETTEIYVPLKGLKNALSAI